MGMSVEEYEKWKSAHPRVVVTENPNGGCVLTVDGDEVWRDYTSEPEDMCLTRDLSVFVYTLRSAIDEAEVRGADWALNALARNRGSVLPDGKLATGENVCLMYRSK